MRRTIIKGLAVVLAVLVLPIALFALFHPHAAVNLTRVGTAGIADVDAFQPAQVVRGCPAAGFEQASPGTLPAAAFAAMKSYSDKLGGAALLVLVDGRIAGESYAPGIGPDTRLQSMSMHKSVVGMVTGAAIAESLNISLPSVQNIKKALGLVRKG